MSDTDRDTERFDISIVGTLRTGTGKREVTIVDLSEQGCRIFDRLGYLSPNLSVTIKIGPVGPIDATVRWQEQPYAGIRFNNPLYPAVLEHIRGHFDLRHEVPSAGDTSYPGMLVHGGELWASYYASHEGKAAIYLARMPLKGFE